MAGKFTLLARRVEARYLQAAGRLPKNVAVVLEEVLKASKRNQPLTTYTPAPNQLDKRFLPKHVRVSEADWAYIVENDLLTAKTTGERLIATELHLSEKGLSALQAWKEKSRGKLIYKTLEPNEISVHLGDIELGTWSRNGVSAKDLTATKLWGDTHEVQGWKFRPDANDQELQAKLLSIKSQRFEGAAFPAAAKHWLAAELKTLGIIS